MYPVKLGFNDAAKRIQSLIRHGHHAEALVTSVFTLEKTIRRSLRLAIIARGFTGKQANQLLGRKGFEDLKEIWRVFEKNHTALPEFVGNEHWQFVPEAVRHRNQLVHGARVYSLAESKLYAERTLSAIKRLRQRVIADYGIDPWTRQKGRRKSKLQWNP
jgi:hypothetical protein